MSKIDFQMFTSEKSVILKGIKGTTAIFCPTEPRYNQLLEMHNLLNSKLIGRKEEEEIITCKLEELYNDIGGGLVVVKGPPGVGKTHLVRHLVKTTDKLSTLVVFHACASANLNVLQTRASLAPRSFQFCQASGFNAWPQVIIKAFTIFREGVIEPSGGKVGKDADITMLRHAFTTFVPGRMEGVNDGVDNIEARTLFVKSVAARFLPTAKSKFDYYASSFFLSLYFFLF